MTEQSDVKPARCASCHTEVGASDTYCKRCGARNSRPKEGDSSTGTSDETKVDRLGISKETVHYFISRTGGDKEIAVAIAAIIQKAGLKTWLQDEDFGNTSFVARMEEGFKKGLRVIALLSPGYLKSDYCVKEYSVTLVGDPLNRKERLIVLRVQECAPEGMLTDIPYVDLVPILANLNAQQREEHLKRIINALIGVVRRREDVDFLNLYRRKPRQIIHREVDAYQSFAGRGSELDTLKNTLWGKDKTTTAANVESIWTALCGLGGIGKSVLAREYAWRNRDQYYGIWWVRAERRDTLVNDLMELGSRYIPFLKEAEDRDQAVRGTLDFFEDVGFDKPWLFIYDNVEQPMDIEKLAPRTHAHVLITTRWSNWFGRAAELPLDVFTPEVAVSFLSALARRDDRAAAAALASDLGYLPLALAHARSSAWAMAWDFDRYRRNLPELIKKAPRDVHYPATVYATFFLALKKAIDGCSEAETLMGIIANLAPDRIPLAIIGKDLMGEIKLGEALAALSEVSLIKVDTLEDGSQTFSVHRLVQMVMRDYAVQAGTFAKYGDIAASQLKKHILDLKDKIKNTLSPGGKFSPYYVDISAEPYFEAVLWALYCDPNPNAGISEQGEIYGFIGGVDVEFTMRCEKRGEEIFVRTEHHAEDNRYGRGRESWQGFERRYALNLSRSSWSCISEISLDRHDWH